MKTTMNREPCEETIMNKPRMMTVREIAATGLLPENALRVMLKSGTLPAVYSGRKAFINYDSLCTYLNTLSMPSETSTEK